MMKEGTRILPLPTEDLMDLKERRWRVKLPTDYRDFLKENNGGIPQKNCFWHDDKHYEVYRFLCVLLKVEKSEFEINVVRTKLDNRLVYDENLVGAEIMPIAELKSGDYVCLDFHESRYTPTVCLWNNRSSVNHAPVTYPLAKTFTEFLEMLR